MTRIGGWGLLVVAWMSLGCTGPTTVPTTTQPPRTTTRAGTTTITTTTTTVAATTTTTEVLPELAGLSLEVVAEGLHQPVFVAADPRGERLLAMERTGRILAVGLDGGVAEDPFLDLGHLVGSGGIEQGLLGLAFHPEYERNGRLFVYFTDRADDTRLVEFRTEERVVDRNDGEVLLVIDQPAIRHNGGMLQFGPDGYLYVGAGDGASGGREAQDTSSLLGAVLRLDVEGGDPYAVPPGNPFVDGGGAAEIWAYGLRNPWRFWIDAEERLLYVGDVGQEDREEIDVASLDRPGLNFGWPVMEGSDCFVVRDCDPEAFEPPVVEYSHVEGCSVTGGVVYRGEAIPELVGHYLYSDWCGGWLRSFRYRDGEPIDHRDWTAELGVIGQVNSFGVDHRGEPLLVTWDGRLLRLLPVR